MRAPRRWRSCASETDRLILRLERQRRASASAIRDDTQLRAGRRAQDAEDELRLPRDQGRLREERPQQASDGAQALRGSEWDGSDLHPFRAGALPPSMPTGTAAHSICSPSRMRGSVRRRSVVGRPGGAAEGRTTSPSSGAHRAVALVDRSEDSDIEAGLLDTGEQHPELGPRHDLAGPCSGERDGKDRLNELWTGLHDDHEPIELDQRRGPERQQATSSRRLAHQGRSQ